MPRSDYLQSKREAKKARIFFEGTKYNHRHASPHVPWEHKDKFAVIQSLGRVQFATYGYTPNIDTHDKPWQLKNKVRAGALVRFATRCRKECINEAGWRYGVEARVFERFDIEVACPHCRKRLWRSEVEVNPASSNSKTTSLGERQRKREACKCNANGRDDHLDSGISELFSSRIEETVHQTRDIDPNSYNPKRKPDRMHGLRRTKNFEKVLQEYYAHDESSQATPRPLEDVLDFSVHPDNGGDPLLFPFLVVEAKSEKGNGSFEHMEMQTQFPIRDMLQLQYRLLKMRGNNMDVPGGPLVWFFANRGEDWRVYGGYVHEEDGRPNYRIEHLWNGSITGLDEALQLILIVDYILDWARDIYRRNILRQLKMLTSNIMTDAMTSVIDPDNYSHRGEVYPWMEAQNFDPEEIADTNDPDAVLATGDDEPIDSLTQFTSPHGLVRDARVIESRLRGLYITRDNVDTLLQGFENPNRAMRFARSILATLNRRYIELENEEVLNEIEDKWTGNVNHRPSLPEQRPRIYAQFRVSYYIDHTWEQVRELTYLAASEDAREVLIERAQFRIGKRSRFDPPKCPTHDILHTIDECLGKSVRQGFVAALARRTYMMDMMKPRSTLYEIERSCEQTDLVMTLELDRDKKSPGVSMRDLVHAVYEMHRIGKREPNEAFLRVSARFDCEGRPLWRGWSARDKVRKWEVHLGKILVFGDILNARNLARGSEQKLCLYILDGQTQILRPFSIIGKLFYFLFLDHIYGTVRKGKVYKTSRMWSDNRTKCYFEIKEVQEHLKISKESIKAHIFDWIKTLSPPVVESPNYEVAARGLREILQVVKPTSLSEDL